MLFFLARAAGVRGMLAHALANEPTAVLELEFELEAVVIAAAEPASPRTAATAAARNQTRLCITSYLRSVRAGSPETRRRVAPTLRGASATTNSKSSTALCVFRRPRGAKIWHQKHPRFEVQIAEPGRRGFLI